jgi:hypothetical protein
MLLIATLHLEGERQPLLGEFHTGSVGFSQAHLLGNDIIDGYLVAPDLTNVLLRVRAIEVEKLSCLWQIHSADRSTIGIGEAYWVVLHRVPEGVDRIPDIRPEAVKAQLNPLVAELVHARTKFPSNQYMFTALAEEIGEMAEAWLKEGDTPHSRHEALQVACVAMRIATEGVNREGEDPSVLTDLAVLEANARNFFASLKDRPELSARS